MQQVLWRQTPEDDILFFTGTVDNGLDDTNLGEGDWKKDVVFWIDAGFAEKGV